MNNLFNYDLLQIMGPAFIAGLIIAVTHASLGLEVIKRGIIFIDLSIAQFAGLGLVLANYLCHEPSFIIIQSFALSFAFMGAIFFYLIEQKLPKEQEAIIGSSFVVVASLSLLLLSKNPHGAEEAEHLLSGQILFITWHDLIVHIPIYLAIMLVWFTYKKQARKGSLFYLIFATAITSSVQLVGIYVVFASLILPAIASYKAKDKLVIAYSTAIFSLISALIISIIFDLPAGPVIVLGYAIVTIGVRLLLKFK